VLLDGVGQRAELDPGLGLRDRAEQRALRRAVAVRIDARAALALRDGAGKNPRPLVTRRDVSRSRAGI
jgi:hypothetical protein